MTTVAGINYPDYSRGRSSLIVGRLSFLPEGKTETTQKSISECRDPELQNVTHLAMRLCVASSSLYDARSNRSRFRRFPLTPTGSASGRPSGGGYMAPFDKDAIRSDTLPLMTLIDAANVAQRGLEKRLSHLHLSVAQQRILALVYFAKENLTPSMLAALLLQETHSVSGLLNRLEDRDLITRTRDRQDRRVVWVGLTTGGRKVAEEAIDIATGMSKEFDTVLTGPNSKEMVEVVRGVRDLGFRIAGVREDVRREALKRVWG
ncbi:MAG: MarR family transcriptional regulator [Dehalococcoidia bacterium]|nr:MarR family transcriptional regulator [Dehalococcoidia bacterium]